RQAAPPPVSRTGAARRRGSNGAGPEPAPGQRGSAPSAAAHPTPRPQRLPDGANEAGSGQAVQLAPLQRNRTAVLPEQPGGPSPLAQDSTQRADRDVDRDVNRPHTRGLGRSARRPPRWPQSVWDQERQGEPDHETAPPPTRVRSRTAAPSESVPGTSAAPVAPEPSTRGTLGRLVAHLPGFRSRKHALLPAPAVTQAPLFPDE